MNWKRIFTFIATVALIGLPACNLQTDGTGTASPQFDIMTAVAATLTAMAPESAGPTTAPLVIPLVANAPTVTVSVNTNCRVGPGTIYDLVGGLNVGETANVVGRDGGGNYWVIADPGAPGGTCWIWSKYATVSGNTAGLPVIAAPATPTPLPTFTPTATPKVLSIIQIPHGVLKPLHPILPLAHTKLDYTATANYGEANLSAGFHPDPYVVGMTSGGVVDVSYLGTNCTGFATVAPDLRVNFSGNGASLLRIYFVASGGDPTMIVNDPYGNYYCVDDSFGTVNPTIDFNNPAGGTYDVWIGSYASGSNISGNLYLTEAAGNHP